MGVSEEKKTDGKRGSALCREGHSNRRMKREKCLNAACETHQETPRRDYRGNKKGAKKRGWVLLGEGLGFMSVWQGELRHWRITA